MGSELEERRRFHCFIKWVSLFDVRLASEEMEEGRGLLPLDEILRPCDVDPM